MTLPMLTDPDWVCQTHHKVGTLGQMARYALILRVKADNGEYYQSTVGTYDSELEMMLAAWVDFSIDFHILYAGKRDGVSDLYGIDWFNTPRHKYQEPGL